MMGNRIQASAFFLRRDESYLSVNWLENLGCPTRELEIEKIRNTYRKKLHIRQRDKIAVLNVGETREQVYSESPDRRNIVFIHDPAIGDPSHGGIYNLNPDNELIAELILETVCASYPARIAG